MTKSLAWISSLQLLVRKELTCEFRSPIDLLTMGMFMVTSLLVPGFALASYSISPGIASTLFWTLLLFSTITLCSRTFLKEEEQKTADTLRLVVSDGNFYLGKLIYHGIILAIFQVVYIPLFHLIIGLGEIEMPLLVVVTYVGLLSLNGALTALGAMVAKSTTHGPLLLVIAFPFLLPILGTTISVTTLLLTNTIGSSELWNSIQTMVGYSGMVVTLSYLLFEFI